MEALTDKIIKLMIAYKEEHHNPIVKSSAEHLIDCVREMEEEAEFEEASKVLVKHLNNPTKYHPHFKVIIDCTSAELLEGKISINRVFDYVVD